MTRLPEQRVLDEIPQRVHEGFLEAVEHAGVLRLSAEVLDARNRHPVRVPLELRVQAPVHAPHTRHQPTSMWISVLTESFFTEITT